MAKKNIIIVGVVLMLIIGGAFLFAQFYRDALSLEASFVGKYSWIEAKHEGGTYNYTIEFDRDHKYLLKDEKGDLINSGYWLVSQIEPTNPKSRGQSFILILGQNMSLEDKRSIDEEVKQNRIEYYSLNSIGRNIQLSLIGFSEGKELLPEQKAIVSLMKRKR